MPSKGPNVSRVGHTNDTSGKSHNAKLLSRNSYKFIFTPVSSVNTPVTPVAPVESVPSVTEEQVSLAITSLIEGLNNLTTTQFNTQATVEILETIQASELSSQYAALSMLADELFNFPDFGQIFTNESLTFLLPELYWNPPNDSNPPN